MNNPDKPFQRVGSVSNAHVGREFEIVAQDFFKSKGISLSRGMKIPIGVGKQKNHSFDLGCRAQKVVVECKSHTWTAGARVPSAKLTVWNEAMFYFFLAPKGYRKIMFILRDFSERHNETLAEYYLRTHDHLIPDDVEFWEYNEETSEAVQLWTST